MKRKKWTPQEEVTESVLKFREKRKWQISLRRYVLEQNKCSFYAPYFGLDTGSFRNWIELQFSPDMNWDNFSQAWQFDHIVPVTYFDFEQESELRLCWNFTNIRAEKLDLNKNRGNRVDVLAAKAYFDTLYQRTQYSLCLDMVRKIERIEVSEIESTHHLETFILDNREYIDTLASFSSHEYNSLNEGASVKQILAEREFLKNLGG
jgi:hypothetical protein